ncbi:MAG: ABC transporter permease [Hyphomicrobiaceae bacterium]
MVERTRSARITHDPILQIRGLNVFYGQSHALQGVDLTLESGVLSVVGRNGMGKTTMCKAIMGLVRASSGSIRFDGEELVGRSSSEIANLGLGYVPQGRRLWPSLSVDEHLRLCQNRTRGGWDRERIYATFPRLAERRKNGGGQLSGGEQQMLAISRALLANPRLLIMDEPTEGLAPVIVAQVEEMLIELADESEMSVLVIEQNIGVATAVSEHVAIMVNGRVNRVMDAGRLAADRELQQRLLGVGRHSDEDSAGLVDDPQPIPGASKRNGRKRLTWRSKQAAYISNPVPPTRWSQPVDEALTRRDPAKSHVIYPGAQTELRPLTAEGGDVVLVVGTFDTKSAELKFIRDVLFAAKVKVRTVDVSTSGKPSGADVPPHQIAIYHPRGPNAVFTNDRGESVREMSKALQAWMRRQHGIAGLISAGGSGGTALVTPAMRSLSVGIPKVMISTVASGDVRQYVGSSDILMMYSVADIQGINSISRKILSNGANAVAGMVLHADRGIERASRLRPAAELPAVGMTMFGVTTPCIQQIVGKLEGMYDCIVFHATGVGGQSMESLVDAGLLMGVVDVTTTEVCDMLMEGVFAATQDRFGAIIRTEIPYVGACGALDMVNFGARDSVPEKYRSRNLYEHNPQVTLMRTSPEENDRIGRWIGSRLNQMSGDVRFFLPEGGVSLIDAPGKPFHDPEANAALFAALEASVKQTSRRQLIRLPHNVNDPAFSDALVQTFLALHSGQPVRRRNTR